jgi:hypothetical protein
MQLSVTSSHYGTLKVNMPYFMLFRMCICKLNEKSSDVAKKKKNKKKKKKKKKKEKRMRDVEKKEPTRILKNVK